MKRSGPGHPKTKGLARRLGVSRFATVGLLELLWHFTAEFAPAGDVGRWADDDIAEALGWDRKAQDLIDALVECGWLDRDETGHRLVVHDWSDHAEDSVHMKLARERAVFANGHVPKLTRLPREERAAAAEHYAVHTENTRRVHGVATASTRRACAQPGQASAQPAPAPSPSPPIPAGTTDGEDGRFRSAQLLIDQGVKPKTARDLGNRYTPERIRHVVQYVGQEPSKNPAGRIVRLLQSSRPNERTKAGNCAQEIEHMQRRAAAREGAAP